MAGINTPDELFMQLSTGMLLPQLVVSRLFSEEIDTADDHEITLLLNICWQASKAWRWILHAAAIRFMAIPLLGICLAKVWLCIVISAILYKQYAPIHLPNHSPRLEI